MSSKEIQWVMNEIKKRYDINPTDLPCIEKEVSELIEKGYPKYWAFRTAENFEEVNPELKEDVALRNIDKIKRYVYVIHDIITKK